MLPPPYATALPLPAIPYRECVAIAIGRGSKAELLQHRPVVLVPICGPSTEVLALAGPIAYRLLCRVVTRHAHQHKRTVKQSDFLARHCADLPSGLAAAVIRQSGGWQSFKENAPDISARGIDAGFDGWIYTADCLRFYEQNRASIVDWLSSVADDCGLEPLEMLASWRCLRDCSQAEILQTIAGTAISNTVANGLAWGAAKDVARRYSDAAEG